MKEKCYFDESLGKIVLRENIRARRIILRTRPEAIYITIPVGVAESKAKEMIEQFRAKLLLSRKKVERKRIDLDFTINSELFNLTLVSGTQSRFLAHSELGMTKIICPPTANFADESLQEWLRKVVEEALRKNAKIVLSQRLHQLSVKVGLPYNSLKISSSQGRWGSCTSRKNINLSYYLLLLPNHLIDYVILHELAHTREMNHGPHFWAILNQMTNMKSEELRAELKKYNTSF